MTNLHGDGPIVMVDDDELDISLVAHCMERSDLVNEFLSFTSGPSFLEHMAGVKELQWPMPAVVFLDINMPFMDGFTVLEQLRSDDAFIELPVIIFLSNSDSPRDIQRCEELHARFQEKFERIVDCVDFLNSLNPRIEEGATSP